MPSHSLIQWQWGRGEGEQDTRSLGRLRIGLGAWGSPEEPHGVETFVISSLKLRPRLLAALDDKGETFAANVLRAAIHLLTKRPYCHTDI